MGSDLHMVSVERWREGTTDEIVESAAACGMDAAGVRAIIERMGAGDRAVELDLHIEQIHPDAPLVCIDHGFMVMLMHSAGWSADHNQHLQERIEQHFGGFDAINSYDFAFGPNDACFAFSLIEEIADPRNTIRHKLSEEENDAVAYDRARVRVWMAWELGRGLAGATWYSRAWAPGQQDMWINHMPAARAPRIGPRVIINPEQVHICAIAMARGRVFSVGEEDGALVCCEASSGELLWRSEAMLGGGAEGQSVSVSADGERIYATRRGWAARTSAAGDGERVEPLAAGGGSSAMAEDCEGRLFELQTYSDDEAAYGGAIWEHDRVTGERLGSVLVMGDEDEAPELSAHTFARRAPVGAALEGFNGVAHIWERGQITNRIALGHSFCEVALSEHGETLYVLVKQDEARRVEAWDVKSGERRWSAWLNRWSQSIGEIVALPGSAYLAISGGGQIALFDVERREVVSALAVTPGQQHTFLHGLGVSAEGDHLFVSADQAEIMVWPIHIS